MRKLLIVGLVFAALNANAKLGDTVEQTNKLFGQPSWTTEDGNLYFKDGLTVIAVFDGDKVCQGLIYLQVNEELSGDVVTKLDDENIPAHTGEWIQIMKKNDPDGVYVESWVSSKLRGPFMVLAEEYSYGGMHFYGRGYTSMQGAFLFEKVGNIMLGYSNNFKAPAKTYY